MGECLTLQNFVKFDFGIDTVYIMTYFPGRFGKIML